MILAVSLTGCQKENTDGILMSDWIRLIDEKAGIISYRQKEQYYLNITVDMDCYDAVQAAVEWEILDPAVSFDPDAYLNREWMAFTLMNLCAKKDPVHGSYANDINKSRFPDAVNSAIASGLMETDKRNLFHPEKTVSRMEAETALQKVIAYIDHREIEENVFEVKQNEDIEIKEEDSAKIDYETMTASFEDIESGGYVRTFHNGQEEIWHVIEEDGIQTLQECNIEDIAEDIELSGSSEIDFEKAEITGPDGEIMQELSYSDDEAGHFHYMSAAPLSKIFQYGDWRITLRVSSGSISASAAKTLAHGESVTAEAKLNGLKVDYEWLQEKGDLKNAYFRAEFHTDENFAVKGTENKYLYSDFSKVTPESFIGTITSFYQQKKDVIDGSFTLCTIKVPIPNAPGMTVTTDLKLILHASGKAELDFGQDTVCGMEVRNGSLRMIKDFSATKEALVRSDFRLTNGIRIALDMLNMSLCDVMLEAGANAKVVATVHLFDEDGKMSDAATEVDAYAADLMSDGNENAFVCADLGGSWVLDLSCNSSATALGKIGLKGKVELLNEANAPLIEGLSGHFENWHKVNRCTYQDRQKIKEDNKLQVSGNIVIEKYAMTVGIGETKSLNVLGLPQGYTLDDLIFASEDSKVAVIAGAKVTAISSGSTNIVISTSDGKYETRCSILVPQVQAK